MMTNKVENIGDILHRLYENYVRTNHELANDLSEVLDHIAQLEFDLDYANSRLNGDWPNYDKHEIGHLVVTWSGDQIAAVSRQDEDGRILKMIAESGDPPNRVKEYDGNW